jgi:mannose-1-phosphate guanylyltransferase
MNALLPELASEHLLYHFESQGYWIKMTDARTFLSAVGPQLEMMRLLSPQALAPKAGAAVPASTEIVGNVLIAESAKIGEDCKLGPDVVIGCVLGKARCVRVLLHMRASQRLHVRIGGARLLLHSHPC